MYALQRWQEQFLLGIYVFLVKKICLFLISGGDRLHILGANAELRFVPYETVVTLKTMVITKTTMRFFEFKDLIHGFCSFFDFF